MKRILLSIIVFATVYSIKAQAPQLLSYQAVVRDTANNIVAGKTVGMRISILQGGAAGTAIYEETQKPLTNAAGLLSIQIGAGTVVTGVFANINWATGPYFIKTETDPKGGTSYTITGTAQLLSVPYALYAGESGPAGKNPGDMLYWNGKQWGLLPVGLAGQQLLLRPTPSGLQPSWFGASAPVFNTMIPYSITHNSVVTGINVSSAGGPLGAQSLKGGILISVKPFTAIAMEDSIWAGKSTSYYSKSYYAGSGQPPLGVGKNPITVPGLQASTTYYIVAFASNAATVSLDSTDSGYPIFGSLLSFTTSAPLVPTVTTNPVFAINKVSARGGGVINSDGGAVVTNSGIVWGTSPNPDTTLSSKTTNGSSLDSGSFRAVLTGLIANTTYYVRAYAVNKSGIAYGNQVSFKTNNATFAIGELYGGGAIFYLDSTGNHGLIASLADQSNSIAWWNGSIKTDGKSDTATAIGKGAANTTYIIAAQGTGTYAASIARNYNGGGFTDWYLPSLLELQQLFFQQSLVGGFTDTWTRFWSSSEHTLIYNQLGFADDIDFNVGELGHEDQTSAANNVRAIRSF